MTEHRDRARAANIFDVARLAGVSHQTVSRVMNDLPNVRPATRLKVEEAVKQLGYAPSPAARAMVTRRSRIVGVITTGAADYGPASTALHFNEAAQEARYSVLMVSILTATRGGVRDAIDSLLRQNVEAIVLISNSRSILDAVYEIEIGAPLITVDSSAPAGRDAVSIDQYNGARQAVRHLIELGHREIAHISGPLDSPDAQERLRGWRFELAQHSLVAREPHLGDWTAQSGYEIGRSADASSESTAYFVANDQMALGLIHALTDRGRRVPEDVSVVGFDDIPESGHYRPPLTTVRQDFAALGHLTMSKLLKSLTDTELHREDHIPAVLIVRESTAEIESVRDSKFRRA
ncbi:LacI family DNA-binding transcriptional regulator [Subtercola sp. PAMC28395]|uniref:LacI family DNA-binding transcriptional regulator n=1 Tax=Subtercola sp. PAMC28395 TaxID=2846775 RepID=UPI001C0B3F7E|nr:LacI family DNA-binding transcriptional regulator [Subtercola sp. PAMC28395]QWT24772.1 LacI family DNA-binding transcriptional regulator [Subtercola sp. PAMC28395]